WSSGAILISAVFGIVGWGWWMLAHANAEHRELRREKAWARIYITPLLQAETDRDLVRRLEAVKRREAALMADHPDWAAGDLKAPVKGIGKAGVADPNQAEPVYHTQRHVVPTYVYLPPAVSDEDKASWSVLAAQWWRGSTMFMKNPRYQVREDFTKDHPIGE
ncbi:hypothetical protein BC831DRAFT_477282, partial [Entophlyctis helioformis]